MQNKIQNAKNALAKTAPTTKELIEQMNKTGQIAKALPSVMTPERFTRIVLSTLSSNPKLQSCSPNSFLSAMMTAAQLGVEPNTPLGQAYLIPYGNSCQFQLGYKGLIDLAYRSGEIVSIQARAVYENDDFHYEFGIEPKLKHIPADENQGEPIAFYAVFKTKNGGYGFEVMSISAIREHAKKYSKAYSNSPWQTNFEEMAKKTVLKKVLKYAPLKTEFMRELSLDESVKTRISEDMTTVPNSYEEVKEDSDNISEANYIEVDAKDIVCDPETGEVISGV